MHRLLCTVCVVWSLGCSDHAREEVADTGVNPRGNAPANALGGYRCAVSEPQTLIVDPTAAGEFPWFLRGPDGTRVHVRTGSGAELHWVDPVQSGDIAASFALRPGRFGWTGSRYVAVLASGAYQQNFRVVSLNPDGTLSRPLRTPMSEKVCDPTVTEMGGRVLLTWYKRARDGCDAGEASFAVLGREGEVLGAARSLSEDGLVVDVRSIEARWDFGRAVISAQRSNTGLDLAWVVDPSGELLWQGRAGGIACPRSGCVRVRADREVSAGDGVQGSMLRFERLEGAGPGFALSAAATDVRALVVSDDKVLVMHTPEEAEGGCDLTVVDVGARLVVAQQHLYGTPCLSARVGVTPRGFVIAGNNGAPSWRALDCTR